MATRIYGESDDLIEFDGDFTGEVNWSLSDEHYALVIVSDGTILRVHYGKGDAGIWSVTLERKGSLFDRIDQCVDEDATPHSDVAHFREGVRWAYFAKTWQLVN
jgi:hypothetical protein